MEFKKEFIHCVPDESLIGKRVLCADTYKEIIEQVESDNWKSCREILVEIDENKAFCPFGIKEGGSNRVHYCPFVYYDPEWNEETTYYCYLDRDDETIQFMFDHEKPSSHIYAEFTDISLANSWCEAHDKFAEIAKAWEDGKTIQYNSGTWKDCADNQPSWELGTEYRIKPDEEIYDVYITTCFQHTPEFMIFKHSMAVHRGGICYYKGTKSECENWIESHKKFKDLMYAWEYEDKTIQYYSESWEDWEDCPDNNPFWNSNIEYRVKLDEPVEVETSEGKMYLANGAEIPKKRRMTNRELAKWIAQGKGQWKGVATCAVKNSYSYIYGTDDIKVPDSIMIRGWNETEWHEPEVEVSV